MKLFKIPAGTSCMVRNPSKDITWKPWKTSHDNIFALEQMMQDPLVEYNHQESICHGESLDLSFIPYMFKDYDTDWEIRVLYSRVELLA